MNADYQRLIDEARTDLVTHMAEYVRSQQMPLHLTGVKLEPAVELGQLQEIYRRMYMIRERLRLFAGLFACHDCGHLEGEHHAHDCAERPGQLVTRPKGWVAPPPSEPAEIVDLTPQPCGHPACPYVCLPGTKFCAQHQGEAIDLDKIKKADEGQYAKEYEQKPEPSPLQVDRHMAVRAGRVSAEEAIEVMQLILERKVPVTEAGPMGSLRTIRVFVTSTGHRLAFFQDDGDLDYLDAIRFPDGREGEYSDWCPPGSRALYNPADDIDARQLKEVLRW